MEFPITRQRLKHYKKREAVAAEVRQRVAEEIKKICNAVENKVLTTNDERYIYEIGRYVKYGFNQPSTAAVCLKELLTAIVTMFPDSSVVVDPLETYILIDWS
jgi:hypothetical protein